MSDGGWARNGFVVLCCGCNKTRDSGGRWAGRVVVAEKGVVYSHGLCPDCMSRIYGNEAWYRDYSKRIPKNDV